MEAIKDGKSNGRRKKELLEKIIDECREKADLIIANWKPVNASWPTIDGGAYLRLSTDEQVAVEKGSMEQQINIAVSEALIRSQTEKVNYRITKFFIEPGITGTTDRRPEFQLLLSQIGASKLKFIIMKELARITREITVWKGFFNLCIQHECQIIIRGFPFNPNDPAQIFQLDILAAFAEYESNQTSRRVRESVYSAMVTSGKFNSTHRVLGFRQLIVNNEPQVGFYVPDNDELKTVTWMMETFVKYGSYTRTLEECKKLGIKNWNDEYFKTHSLGNLLSNTRYIGKWRLNAENQNKDQSRLMPYDRYTDIDLPLGAVIDLDLWQRVQDTISRIKGSKDKNTNLNRVYPLSGGLLIFKDGSRFSGESAWKDDYRHTYYNNQKNGIRLVAENVETEVEKIVSEIVRGSAKIQNSISDYGKDCTAASELCLEQVTKLKGQLTGFEDEKRKLNRRLDYVLDGGSETDAQKFKGEYKSNLEKINLAIRDKQIQIEQLVQKAETLRENEFDWNGVGERCEEILATIRAKDPVALKNAYRQLFEAIVVGDIGPDGKTDLKFVLSGQNFGPFLDSVNGRKEIRVGTKMAQEEGLGLSVARLTLASCRAAPPSRQHILC